MARATLVALVLICSWSHLCHGQGLDENPRGLLGASSAQARLEVVYQGSRAWRNAYLSRPSVCSKSSGSLCASGGLSAEQRAQLQMATSPQAYDSRNPKDTGGFNAVGPVKNQGDCNTCVSFAVLAAVQSAMACALQRDATSRISEQDFFFCKAGSNGEYRTCSSSWTMQDGIQTWTTLDQNNQFPVMDYCLKYDPDNTDCSSTCKDTDPDLQNGQFKWNRLQQIWDVMDQIRTWGSVVTRLDVYDDFKPFFQKNPSGIYPGQGPSAKFVESHAILLVGYDMNSNPPYWIAKNSWGTSFASGGFFKIAFGKAGVCSPDDTFGMMFQLNSPPAKPWNRLSASSQPGCYMYLTQPGDYISKVARTFGLGVNALGGVLADNTGIVKQPDEWLDGIQIKLCGINVPVGVKVGPAPTGPGSVTANASTPSPAKAGQQKPTGYKPVKYNPNDDAPYTGPLYNLQIGTYKGSYSCDGAQGTGTMVLQKDDIRNVGQVRVETTFVQGGQCTYKMVLACNSVRDGTGTWCGGDDEPWDCGVDSISSWDACGGKTPAKTNSLQMCFSNNQLILKSEKPKCGDASGTLKKS